MGNISSILLRLLPQAASSDYQGSRVAYWVFVILSTVSFGRSCIHLFAADGGAGSIASLDLSRGAENIVFSFGLWGLSQILYALVQLLVAFRYRSLIPLMYLLLILETLGRMYIGRVKPPIYATLPPGAVANYLVLPLAALMLVLSLSPARSASQ